MNPNYVAFFIIVKISSTDCPIVITKIHLIFYQTWHLNQKTNPSLTAWFGLLPFAWLDTWTLVLASPPAAVPRPPVCVQVTECFTHKALLLVLLPGPPETSLTSDPKEGQPYVQGEHR